MPYATPAMGRALQALVRFYRTGSTDDRRAYDIAWVEDRDSPVDTINGFVEIYMDARGRKGSWEALVYYLHPEKTAAISRIAEHAQWFEDRMPWDPRYRKPRVTGVTARAIEVVIETGDSGPMTPIGINLPNDQEIRETHGSKSVSLSNVLEAYEKSTPRSFRAEFSWDEDEIARATRWGAYAGELTTNLHEVIGHGSGLVSESLKGMPEAALEEQFSAIEESRADLVALYFIADPYMVELGLIPAGDLEDVVRAEYESYARNALVQLRRVRDGSQIEEDHMRNRQMIVRWLMAHTDAITAATRDGKTFYRVGSLAAFRSGVARLLSEVQRIKAEGDYEAARTLHGDIRRPLRPGTPGRSRRPRRSPRHALLHRGRDAQAGTRARQLGDRGRHNHLPGRLHRADAGVRERHPPGARGDAAPDRRGTVRSGEW